MLYKSLSWHQCTVSFIHVILPDQSWIIVVQVMWIFIKTHELLLYNIFSLVFTFSIVLYKIFIFKVIFFFVPIPYSIRFKSYNHYNITDFVIVLPSVQVYLPSILIQVYLPSKYNYICKCLKIILQLHFKRILLDVFKQSLKLVFKYHLKYYCKIFMYYF